jgi:hypothetical protein
MCPASITKRSNGALILYKMAATGPPLSVVLLAASPASSAAASSKHGGGRMAITIRAPGGAAPRVVAVAVAPVVAPSKWHTRRLEDEVAHWRRSSVAAAACSNWGRASRAPTTSTTR